MYTLLFFAYFVGVFQVFFVVVCFGGVCLFLSLMKTASICILNQVHACNTSMHTNAQYFLHHTQAKKTSPFSLVCWQPACL